MTRLLAVVLAGLVLAADSVQAQGMCDNPQESCGRLLTPACLDRVGAAALPAEGAGGDCAAQMQTYRECLSTVATTCTPQATPGRAAAPTAAPAQAGRWVGLWLGWITCSNGDVWDDVSFDVTEQKGPIGVGKWRYEGVRSGRDTARIFPDPNGGPSDYLLVTKSRRSYDYELRLENGAKLTGVTSGQIHSGSCKIELTRG